MFEDSGGGCVGGEHVFGFFLEALEGGEDVFDVVAFDAVKQKVRSVEFGHKVKPFCVVPFVNRGLETSGLGQRNHIVARAGQFQHPDGNPFFESMFFIPRAFLPVEVGVESRDLVNNKIAKIYTANFLSADIVIGKSIEIAE